MPLFQLHPDAATFGTMLEAEARAVYRYDMGNMIFERTSISAYVFVDNGKRCVQTYIPQSLWAAVSRRITEAARSGWLFSSSSLRQQEQEAFCTVSADLPSCYALSLSLSLSLSLTRPLKKQYNVI